MPGHASLGLRSSERRNWIPESEVRKVCNLSDELTWSSSLSCATACALASRYWRTALKISHATQAPVPKTAKTASCCLSNGESPSITTTSQLDDGKQERRQQEPAPHRLAVRSRTTPASTATSTFRSNGPPRKLPTPLNHRCLPFSRNNSASSFGQPKAPPKSWSSIRSATPPPTNPTPSARCSIQPEVVCGQDTVDCSLGHPLVLHSAVDLALAFAFASLVVILTLSAAEGEGPALAVPRHERASASLKGTAGSPRL